tara:strand:+ start:535 stop:789 length:255 start_codon:yes stop_codon:yes gene_type:complete
LPQDFWKLPKFKIDIADIQYGYPNAQPVFGDEKRQEKEFIYINAPNGFVAEIKAEEIYQKKPEKYDKILKDTISSAKKKGRHKI